MPGTIPNPIWLYRIVHIDNLEYILANGLFTKNHKNADPDYINIGDSGLILQRNDFNVPIDPNGTLGDYIPFYFGPLSPMLLNIKTGHRGITQRPQSDIVYVCCNLQDVIRYCKRWCFTDGHAKNNLTEFYNSIDHLDKIDWDVVAKRYWNNTEEDFDMMRRKQADFLVKGNVAAKCIDRIVVYNTESCNLVEKIIRRLKAEVTVHVNPKGKFYY